MKGSWDWWTLDYFAVVAAIAAATWPIAYKLSVYIDISMHSDEKSITDGITFGKIYTFILLLGLSGQVNLTVGLCDW